MGKWKVRRNREKVVIAPDVERLHVTSRELRTPYDCIVIILHVEYALLATKRASEDVVVLECSAAKNAAQASEKWLRGSAHEMPLLFRRKPHSVCQPRQFKIVNFIEILNRKSTK
jgi:hypothetical protein